MNNRVFITIADRALLYEGRMEPLLCGKCEAFLPASMISGKEGVRLCFQTDGYKRLASLKRLTALQILDVVGKVMQNMKLCREYLYYPEDYVLSPDTVYCSNEGKVRFLYLPSDRKISETKVMQNFCYR